MNRLAFEQQQKRNLEVMLVPLVELALVFMAVVVLLLAQW